MQTRRSVTSTSSSSSSSSSAKRPAVENAAKVSAGAPQKPKKRVALGNLTNLGNVGRNPTRPSANGGSQVCV